MFDDDLNRDEAMLVLSGMLEIMDLVQDIVFITDGAISSEELMKMVQNRCADFNNQYTPTLVVMS